MALGEQGDAQEVPSEPRAGRHAPHGKRTGEPFGRHMSSTADARDWHGHRIVTEGELADQFAEDGPDQPSERHRFWVRLRHGVVLALLVALLVTGLVGAYLVMTKKIEIPWLASSSSSLAADGPTCPEGLFPYLDPASVTVNVYNATLVSGLASKAAKDLEKRGFQVGEVGNRKIGNVHVVAVVVAGPEGSAQALTLQRNIRKAHYVMDRRQAGDEVDLVLGLEYKKLLSAKKVKTTDGRLGCLPEATPSPSASPSRPAK